MTSFKVSSEPLEALLLAAAGDLFEVDEVFLTVDFLEVDLVDLFFRFGFAIGSVQLWVPNEARRHVRMTFVKSQFLHLNQPESTLHSWKKARVNNLICINFEQLLFACLAHKIHRLEVYARTPET